MLVVRRRTDVLAVLAGGDRFTMAAVTPGGGLGDCPLTGAEMQSPDGGLLNMDGPAHREYRQRVNGLFTRRAAELTRPGAAAMARYLAVGLPSGGPVDVLAAYAEPFTEQAVSWAMGTPAADWGEVLGFSRTAFAVVPSPEAVTDVAAAWENLYAYYGSRPGGGHMPGQIAAALPDRTPDQVTHVVATVSNGFGAVLPVLAVSLAGLAACPRVVNACLRGHRTWGSVADELLATRAMFPVALPRVARTGTWLGDRYVAEGTTVLPSLTAAAHDPTGPPACSIAFGAGPHFCPGAALTRVWLTEALAAFFTMYPHARLAGDLDWQAGTLPVPAQIFVDLR